MQELSLKNCRLDKRYDILERLGHGSYAEIYVARDTIASPQSPHNKVVIKALNVFMQNDLDADLERTLVENFQNEAIALDRVRHPNVVSRLGHGTARDLRGMVFHYLVLEYLAGGDMARLCRDKKLSLSQALDYLEQVCAGLFHAHQSGVIHRDIKPQNLLLTPDFKTVKITDFGVARFSHSDSPITRVGTNMYAPPEHSPMLSTDTGTLVVSELTPAADIYSLAKTAYVLITGESPRFFTNQSIAELPFAMRQEVWANDLLGILRKATQTNPQDRHQDIIEFWKDLSKLKTIAQNESGEITTKVSTRQQSTPQAHVAKGYTPNAPQKPKFNTSRELKYQNNQITAKNPSIVVRLSDMPNISPFQNQPLNNIPIQQNQQLNKFPSPQPPAISEQPIPILQPEEQPVGRKKKYLRNFVIFLIFLGIFTGILYGTYNYVRSIGNLSSIGSIFSKQEAVTLRDIPLRNDSNNKATQIGLVPENSRVRIVNETETWAEVDVIEFGKTLDSNSVSHGWIAKKAVNGENNLDFSR